MIPMISLDTLSPVTALTPVLAAVASAAVKGAVVVALAALAGVTLFRQRSAAARHALWTGALAAHLLLLAAAPFLPPISILAFPLPAWLAEGGGEGRGVEGAGTASVSMSTVASAPAVAPGPIVAVRGRSGVGRGRGIGQSSVTASASATASVSGGLAAQPRVASSRARTLASLDHHLATRLSALWTVGVLLVLGRLVLGTIRVNTLARAAERVTSPDMLALLQRTASRLRIARPVTLLRGDRLDVPITWGVVYPVVLLPADSEEWPEERRRVVLVHELAHVKRLDAVTQLLAQLAIAIFWFDPLVWLAARRMRAEREHACDDFVLRDGTRASLYARELLDMVRRLGRRRADVAAPAFAALAMARRTEFEGRMLAILDPDVERRTLGRAAAAALVAAAVLLLLPLAALHPFGETAHATGRALHAAAAATATGAATTVPLTVAIDRRAAAALAGSRAVAAARAPAALRSPTAAPAETLPIMYRCTRADVRANENTYAIHTDDHRPGRPFVEHYVKKYGRCRHIVLAGRVTFTPDERDVASLGADSRVQLHERTLDWERMLVVTRDADGALRRTYSSNGQATPFDAEARAWVGGLMRDLARESGADAPGRVSRIRAAGGVPAVLADIGEIESAGAKRRHYQALLESGSLTSADVDNIVRHAGRELAGSGDLRAVLRSVPRGNRRSIDAALADAIGRMSDGDKQQVLSGMLDSADTPTLHVVLRLAEQIGSDGEKAAFLRRAAPRVLDPSNATLREAFFRTYASIGSDGEKHVVLNAALKQALKSPTITRDVIRGAVKIGSDGEKAALLRSVAKSRLLTTDELRAEYIRAARTIGSDGEFRAVIDEVLGGKG